jgi:hypothetical protein
LTVRWENFTIGTDQPWFLEEIPMACFVRLYSKVHFVASSLLLISCSDSYLSTSLVSDETETKPTLSFAEWCSGWGLRCEPPSVLSKPAATLKQVQSGFSVFNGFLNSSMSVGFSLEDWKSPRMKEAFDSFLIPKTYEELSLAMDNVGLLGGVASGDGRLRLEFSGKEYEGPSALRWKFAPSAEVSFGDSGDVHFSGVLIQNPSGSEGVNVLRTQATSADTFVFESNLFRVEKVPLWFLSREVFSGFSIPKMQKIPFENFGVGLNRLLKVVLAKPQSISIEKSVLNSLENNFDVLVSQPQKSERFWHGSVKTILKKLEKMSVVATDGKADFSGQLVGKDLLHCAIEGTPMTMEIRKDFGVLIPVQTASRSVVMSFRGIAAKLNILGKPGFNLSTVEYTGEKMIIKGIPLIGEFAVDITKNIEKMDLKCL